MSKYEKDHWGVSLLRLGARPQSAFEPLIPFNVQNWTFCLIRLSVILTCIYSFVSLLQTLFVRKVTIYRTVVYTPWLSVTFTHHRDLISFQPRAWSSSTQQDFLHRAHESAHRGFLMGRGRDVGPISRGKMHQYRGEFTVRYLASLLLILKHTVSIHN